MTLRQASESEQRAAGVGVRRGPAEAGGSASGALSEQRFNALLEHVGETITLVDRTDTIVYESRSTERVLGFSASSRVGSRIDRFVHPDDAPGLRAMLASMRATPRATAGMRARLSHASGAWRILELTASNRLDDPAIGAIVINGRDITEPLETSRTLREIDRRHRSLFASMGQGVVYQDATGAIIDANPAAERMLGATSAELRTAPPGRLAFVVLDARGEPVPRDLLPPVLALRTGQPVLGASMRLFRPGSGETQWLRVDAIPQFRPGSRQAHEVHSIFTDVTAQQEAEESLRFQAQLLDAVGEAVIARTVDGRIVYWNRAAELLYGWSPEEALGRSIAEIAPTMSAAGDETGSISPSGGERQSFEVQVRRRDGTELPALVVESPVTDSEGTLIGIVAITSDLSEYRTLQRQLLNAQKMEAVGRLAGGIAHDFNNMLMVIQGTIELMSDGVDEPERLSTDLEEIRRATARAARLTRQLLAFSRKQILQPEVVDLNATIRGLEKMLIRLLGADVFVELDLAVDLGHIQIDPSQLEQAIVNLAINSRDAMPRGGRLCLRTRNVSIEVREAAAFPYRVIPGSYVCLSVADSGVGMDESALQRAFDPFFTTKEPGKGTGLGLSTVYGFVKQSGGYIWGSSVPGEGTVFRLHFPRVRTRVEPAGEERLEPTAPGGEGTTILVVEDENAVRAVTRRILARSGYRIVEASSGDEALRLLQAASDPVGLVITDVVMPGMNGRELAEAIRRLRPDLKILFMSGYAEEEVQRRGIMIHTDHIILKPFRPEQLLNLVAKCLQVPA